MKHNENFVLQSLFCKTKFIVVGHRGRRMENVGSWLELGGSGAMVRAVAILLVLLLFIQLLRLDPVQLPGILFP